MNVIRFQRPEWNWPSLDDQLSNLKEEINRLFDSPANGLPRYSEFFNGWTPPIDLYEQNDHLLVKAELPGMKKEDIDISYQDGVLSISGERKTERTHGENDPSRSERFFGRFHRSVMLPKAVDASKVKAVYEDGILTITLPKTEEAKPRQIEVQIK